MASRSIGAGKLLSYPLVTLVYFKKGRGGGGLAVPAASKSEIKRLWSLQCGVGLFLRNLHTWMQLTGHKNIRERFGMFLRQASRQFRTLEVITLPASSCHGATLWAVRFMSLAVFGAGFNRPHACLF